MNDQLESDINNFIASVGRYINMEYEAFYEYFAKDNLFDFIGSYYMGGSTVPDTARYVIELLLMRMREYE